MRFEVPDFQNKDKFLITTVIILFSNNKTHCTYLNPLMPGGNKRSSAKPTAKTAAYFKYI